MENEKKKRQKKKKNKQGKTSASAGVGESTSENNNNANVTNQNHQNLNSDSSDVLKRGLQETVVNSDRESTTRVETNKKSKNERSSTQITSIFGSSSCHHEPNPSKRSKTSKSLSINDDDLVNDIRKALQYLIKSKGPTVLECSEKLKLVGLEPEDPLFLAAYCFFGVSKSMRETWMALPDKPKVLKGWIAFMARSKGLIE